MPSSQLKATLLRLRTLLIALDRPIISSGVKVARVKSRDIPSLLLQRVGRVRFVDDRVIPDYFYAWLRSPAFYAVIDPGRSNGVPHISPKDIERIPFSPPPIIEQRRIIKYLDHLEGRLSTLRALQSESAAELDALLPAVLSQAFAGKL